MFKGAIRKTQTEIEHTFYSIIIKALECFHNVLKPDNTAAGCRKTKQTGFWPIPILLEQMTENLIWE